MEPERKKCMICGRPLLLKRSICEACQERIRREALGEQAETRTQAEKELKKHGISPERGREKKHE